MRSAFAEFKDSSFAQRALLKYDNTPFSYAFENAKDKDQEAIIYFIAKSLGPIASAYTRFYVQGRKMDVTEKSHDFFNEFFTRVLHQTENDRGPFFMFDPTVFQPEQQADDAFILDKLRYYIYRYASALAVKLYKKEQKGNFISTASDINVYQSDEGDAPDAIEQAASTAPSAETQISGDAIYNNKPFMEYLKQKKPDKYKFMMLLYKKQSPLEVARAMGWRTDNGVGGRTRSTPSQFYNTRVYIAKLYKLFMSVGGDMTKIKRKKRESAVA